MSWGNQEWRRGRDSNPRYAFDVYSLSRGAPSTTRPPLRCGLIICLMDRMQGLFAGRCVLHRPRRESRWISPSRFVASLYRGRSLPSRTPDHWVPPAIRKRGENRARWRGSRRPIAGRRGGERKARWPLPGLECLAKGPRICRFWCSILGRRRRNHLAAETAARPLSAFFVRDFLTSGKWRRGPRSGFVSFRQQGLGKGARFPAFGGLVIA